MHILVQYSCLPNIQFKTKQRKTIFLCEHLLSKQALTQTYNGH